MAMTVHEAMMALNAHAVFACERARMDRVTIKMVEDALDTPANTLTPRVLKINEIAFLEMAVFVETDWVIEGKGTDLFLAIPYIYAVSQNMECGYIAFVDGNTDVYDLQAYEYGKTWRCWTLKPTNEQRKAVKWDE